MKTSSDVVRIGMTVQQFIDLANLAQHFGGAYGERLAEMLRGQLEHRYGVGLAQPEDDQAQLDAFIDAEVAAAEEADHEAEEARLNQEEAAAEQAWYEGTQAQADQEIVAGYANPDCLDSAEDFRGDE